MSTPTALSGLRGDVTVLETPADVTQAAAALVESASAACVADQGRFCIALTGGNTPRPLYEELAAQPRRSRVAWAAWQVYFGDERAVPPGNPASNFHLARTALLDHVPVPAERVHRMAAERPDLDAAAEEYSALLEATLPRGPGHAPRLDLVLLGLGENGHCASLFPGTGALDVTDRWATRGRADYAPYDRITLTFPALNGAALVAFIVTGGAKSAALRQTAADTTPASRVAPNHGRITWLLDREAAGA